MAEVRDCPDCGEPVLAEAETCNHCGAELGPGLDRADVWHRLQGKLAKAAEGKYEIDGLIGYGGMAGVYRARDAGLNRLVALKLISPAVVMDPKMVRRFRQEAQTMAQLNHPHIVPVFDIREADDLLYIVMQYVPGRTLSEVVTDASDRLPPELVATWMIQISDALAHAHGRPTAVIHRDIKPSNIILDESGRAQLTDFGIAKVQGDTGLTRTGHLIGTPAYMSPEQCRGETITAASDQYSLGTVAYELLAGVPPFRGPTLMVLQAHLGSDPKRLSETCPHCPPKLAAVVEKMLAKHPHERWESMAAVAKALRGAVDRVVPTSELEAWSRRVHEIGLATSVDPLTPGTHERLVARLVDGEGEELVGRRVRWSSTNQSVASVTSDGVLAAHQVGSAVIVGRSGNAYTTLEVEVVPPKPVRIEVDPPAVDSVVGHAVRITVTGFTADGDLADLGEVRWENPHGDLVHVDGDSLTCLAPGDGTIVAVVDDLRQEVAVRVSPVPVASVHVGAPEGPVQVGEGLDLTCRVESAHGQVLEGRTVTWSSSDEEVAEVDDAGHVSARVAGSALVTASCEGVSAQVAIETVLPPVTRIALPFEKVELAGGERRTLVAELFDARGTPVTDRTAQWASSDESVVTVSNDGELVARASGSATVTARCEEAVAEVAVEVPAPELTQEIPLPPSIAPERTQILASLDWGAPPPDLAPPPSEPGPGHAVEETPEPPEIPIAEAVDPEPETSEGSAVAEEPVAEAAPGIGTGEPAAPEQPVEEAPSPVPEWDPPAGDPQAPTVLMPVQEVPDDRPAPRATVVTPVGGEPPSAPSPPAPEPAVPEPAAPEPAVTGGLAGVDSHRRVPPLPDPPAPEPPPVGPGTDWGAIGRKWGIPVGGGVGAVAVILLLWRALASTGDAMPPPLSVSALPEDTTVRVGERFELRLNVPESDLGGRAVTWSSSDLAVATVSPTGVVEAVSPGNVSLSLTGVGIVSTGPWRLTVVEADRAAVTGPSQLTEGEAGTFSLQLGDGRLVPTDSVVWAVSPAGLATIDGSGRVTASNAGSVSVSATYGQVTAARDLVIAPPVRVAYRDLVFDPVPPELEVGGSMRVTAWLLDQQSGRHAPAGLTWTSSNSGVLGSDGRGGFQAVGLGSAVIRASHGESALSRQITVTVVSAQGGGDPPPPPDPDPGPAASEPTRLSIAPVDGDLPLGEVRGLSATVFDQNGEAMAGESLSWTSSAPDRVSVDGSGQARSVAPGSAWVVVSSGSLRDSVEIAVPAPAAPTLAEADVGALVSTFAAVLESGEGNRVMAWIPVAERDAHERYVTFASEGRLRADGDATAITVEGTTARFTLPVRGRTSFGQWRDGEMQFIADMVFSDGAWQIERLVPVPGSTPP